MVPFLYGFATFFQPGVFWPELAPYKPMLVLSFLALLQGAFSASAYDRKDIFLNAGFLCLIGFLVIQIVSVYYSGLASLLEEFGFWYQYVAYLIVCGFLLSSERKLTRFIWGVISGGMFIVSYGIYAVFEKLPSAVKGMAGAYGMYENHNDYSFMIILIFPLLYTFYRKDSGAIRRLALASSMVACVVGILLCLSRGGLLALLLEMFLIIWLTFNREKRAILLTLLTIFSGLGINYQWSTRAEVSGPTYTADDAESSRLELWKAGFNMVKTHPLLGIGSRRFSEFGKDYGELSHDQVGKNAHNTYIQILATTGILGLATFLGVIKSIRRQLRIVQTSSVKNSLYFTGIGLSISFYSLLFRALLDAKTYCWTLYTIFILCLAYITIFKTKVYEESEEDSA